MALDFSRLTDVVSKVATLAHSSAAVTSMVADAEKAAQAQIDALVASIEAALGQTSAPVDTAGSVGLAAVAQAVATHSPVVTPAPAPVAPVTHAPAPVAAPVAPVAPVVAPVAPAAPSVAVPAAPVAAPSAPAPAPAAAPAPVQVAAVTAQPHVDSVVVTPPPSVAQTMAAVAAAAQAKAKA